MEFSYISLLENVLTLVFYHPIEEKVHVAFFIVDDCYIKRICLKNIDYSGRIGEKGIFTRCLLCIKILILLKNQVGVSQT